MSLPWMNRLDFLKLFLKHLCSFCSMLHNHAETENWEQTTPSAPFRQRIECFLIKIFSVEPSKHFKPPVFYIRAHSSFYPTTQGLICYCSDHEDCLATRLSFSRVPPGTSPSPRVYVSGVFAGVPVSSRVSAKIQQLVNTLKQPRRPPLREFFVDDFDELLEG